jgi:hypothetical protein
VLNHSPVDAFGDRVGDFSKIPVDDREESNWSVWRAKDSSTKIVELCGDAFAGVVGVDIDVHGAV